MEAWEMVLQKAQEESEKYSPLSTVEAFMV